LILKCQNNKIPSSTQPFRPKYFGPYTINQNLAPYFSPLIPEVSQKECYIPVDCRMKAQRGGIFFTMIVDLCGTVHMHISINLWCMDGSHRDTR